MSISALPPKPPAVWQGMTFPRYSPGRPGPIRVAVIHATAGSHPGDLDWLTKGGNPERPVSCHYYISKTGRVVQLVKDSDTAWHCGASTWAVDGEWVAGSVSYAGGTVSALNALAVGVELENRNDGHDPYPEAQLAAAIALLRYLIVAYDIPPSQLVRHRDIAPGRKTDPAGLDWPTFITRVYAPPRVVYTAESPLLASYAGDPAALIAAFAARCARSPDYSPSDREAIGGWYAQQCATLGLDLAVVLAQVCHETANLTSALSQRRDRDGRPLRNPAGIGVTGAWSRAPQPGYVWDADRKQYRACVGFRAWATESIPAHVGRLIAYATRPGQRTATQQAAVDAALSFRPLAEAFQGSAPILRMLGKAHNPRGAEGAGWAAPGADYGERIAAVANALHREAD